MQFFSEFWYRISYLASAWYSTLREMIEVREGMAKCYIFNIDDVEFIINDLCVNKTSYENQLYHFIVK